MRRGSKATLPRPSRGWDEADGRPRVLLEVADPAIGWVSQDVLDEAGYAVAVCTGPQAGCARCPVLEGRRCALADEADVIVQMFPMSHRERYPVLAGLKELSPDVPVCVEVTEPYRKGHEAELAGCAVIDFPTNRRHLIDAVAAATPAPSPRRAR